MSSDETTQPAPTVFYDPFAAQSKDTLLDNLVFKNPWDAPASPAVEKTTEIKESENDHGK